MSHQSVSLAGLHRRVVDVLNTLRPAIRDDGGDIELLGVDETGTVRLRLLGACVGCPSSTETLTLGIERTLRSRIPEIKRVVCA